MASQYLQKLSSDEYNELTIKLHNMQNGCCYICQQPIDLFLHKTNIDHIVPLNTGGKDNESNFALTHEKCNKSKQDAHLCVARALHRRDERLHFFLRGEADAADDVFAVYHGQGRAVA